MGGFFICRRESGPAGTDRLDQAEKQFAAHGFGAPRRFETATHRGFHVGYIHGGPETFHAAGDDFIAVAGTLVYRKMMGAAALRHLLADFRLPFADWPEVQGHFALLAHKAGRTVVLTDYFGAFQVFHDPQDEVVSTSFLAAAKCLGRLRFDSQGLYEFAFNVFPAGDDTVFEELRRLGPDVQLELGRRSNRHRTPKPLPERPTDLPLDELLALHAERLHAVAAPFVATFGDRVHCPLSGGLDSRLALAVLRAQGVLPQVYVYGKPGDTDVEVAQQIAAAEGFELEILEKAAWRRIQPDEFAPIVERNFHETDGLVTDGGLFDNGGNAFARHKLQAGGQLTVSGGCGEVFRNFFYLRNRPLRARDVVEAFFARFTPSDTTGRFDPEAFIRALEAKALTALGRDDPRERLGRQVVEQLYPRMRCRAFFGREISLVARHGAYLMPFFERDIVQEAVQLPISLKIAGRFEAQLVARIDPNLARHSSAYGHSFLEPPGRKHRLSEWATMLRPIALRRSSYRIQRALGQVSDEHGGLLSRDFLERVIDLEFPFMRRYFRIEKIRDSGLYRRIATLEYLAQHLQDRLVEA